MIGSAILYSARSFYTVQRGVILYSARWFYTLEGGSTGWPKKVSHHAPIFQKIALKIANEIRFFRKVKV